ncbi:MAG: hypothetical protein HY962_07210 [Ignavibacteriae bacterium]|nr:hypothetical protein [Ignavibacteriota bacterium]
MPPPVDFVYRDIDEWRDMPMHRLVLRGKDNQDLFHFYHLRQGSTWDIQPVTARGMYGDTRTCGWLFEARALVLQNTFEQMVYDLDAYMGRAWDAFVILKPDASQEHGRLVSIWLADPVGVTWAPVQSEGRPSFEVRVTKALTSLYQPTGMTGTDHLWNEDTLLVNDPA